MKIQPDDLNDMGYQLMDSMDQQNLNPFIIRHLKKRTASSAIWEYSHLIALIAIYYMFLHGIHGGEISFGKAFLSLLAGYIFSIIIAPIHELIHYLAFKLMGAKKVTFKVNFKKFYILCNAHNFVANRKEIRFVGLAPFVLLSAMLILLILISGPQLSFFLMGLLIAHTTCCAGDFGILSYLDFHGDREVVSFDDQAKGITCFYKKAAE